MCPQFTPSVTELVVAQCYYLDFDDRNRNKPIYVYLNSTGCINDKGQAISADNEFYAMWASLGFTRAPLFTGVTWKAQNQAAVLLASGQRGHRYSFPHAKISTAPPIMNRVFGQAVDAQLQVRAVVQGVSMIDRGMWIVIGAQCLLRKGCATNTVDATAIRGMGTKHTCSYQRAQAKTISVQ